MSTTYCNGRPYLSTSTKYKLGGHSSTSQPLTVWEAILVNVNHEELGGHWPYARSVLTVDMLWTSWLGLLVQVSRGYVRQPCLSTSTVDSLRGISKTVYRSLGICSMTTDPDTLSVTENVLGSTCEVAVCVTYETFMNQLVSPYNCLYKMWRLMRTRGSPHFVKSCTKE